MHETFINAYSHDKCRMIILTSLLQAWFSYLIEKKNRVMNGSALEKSAGCYTFYHLLKSLNCENRAFISKKEPKK